MKKKIISALAALSLVITAIIPLGVTAYANVPTEFEEVYTADNTWSGSLTVNADKTIKLSSVEHATDGTDGSPVIVTNGATLTIVFEGVNTLAGNANIISAGIEVDEGATLNLYGADDNASLTVTGGKYGAGIGGKGYGSTSTANPICGNINIYSGNITATGGSRAAGIGSGYHSTAGEINIYGGDVKAFGVGCGAGIGSGYGSSGGVAFNNTGGTTGTGIGYYNGGTITISGGRVFASSYVVNPEDVNIYSPEAMFASVTSGEQFAAGIGGGYGASSGVITIDGDAEVTAIGWCGGAGIGTGRGTSKASYFDSVNAFCDITIGGNAKVAAIAGGEYRTNLTGVDGGAAIGLSRGFTLEDSELGTITIKDNATVYAYGSPYANAIGTSSVVGKYTSTDDGISRPMHAQLKKLTIGENCSITAISNGYYTPVFTTENAPSFITLSNSIYKEKYEGEGHGEEFFSTFAPYNADTNAAIVFDFLIPFTTKDEQFVSISVPSDTNTALMFRDRECNFLTCSDNRAFESGALYSVDDIAKHSFTVPTYDSTQHWNKCAFCDEISDKAEHSWNSGVVTKTATPTATGIRTYTCTVCKATRTAVIPKCAKYRNTISVKGKTKTVKHSTVKKKNVTVKRADAITVSKAKGTVSYAKASGNKNIIVNKKTGNITVKKGLKKGTYKVKVKVKSAGNKTYKALTKTVTVTIKVK